jgi:hypothetical protein
MSSAFHLHAAHELELALYGPVDAPENVALECLDCNEVMADLDLTGPERARAERWLDHEVHGVIAVAADGGMDCGCGIRLAEPNE